MALDPITEGLSLGEKLIDLIRLSLPSDEVRLARFKARYQRRYAWIRRGMENDIVKQLKKEYGQSVTKEKISNEVEWQNAELAYTEKEDLKCVLCDRFGLNV